MTLTVFLLKILCNLLPTEKCVSGRLRKLRASLSTICLQVVFTLLVSSCLKEFEQVFGKLDTTVRLFTRFFRLIQEDFTCYNRSILEW